LPDVDDFPVVGQREYRAKAGQYPEPAANAARGYDQGKPDPAAARGGIFQRIVGAGRGREGDATDKSGDQGKDGSRRDAPQLPFFFNRDKR
jgi:hypothetical protein